MNHMVTETLHTPPSWTNRTGRVDRSACLVIRTADVKHHHPRLTLHPSDLHHLLRSQLSGQTAGDRRTRKSNIMKNKDKRDLFLPAGWSQTIQIERHKLHARLTQHFLVCPGCGSQPLRRTRRPRTAKERASAPSLPGRCLKLYLPLCTAAEWRDGNLVRMVLSHVAPWSLGLPTKSLHPAMPPQAVSQLIHRYQPMLFRGLLCRQCLGLRYGEVKPPTPAERVAGNPLVPAWGKKKPAYYLSLTPDTRAEISELYNMCRKAGEEYDRYAQELFRVEYAIAVLEILGVKA